MSEWTDERRAEAVKMYQDKNPTAENSMEIVKEVAEEMNASPNGVRMILSKENVYIKKETTKSSTSASKTSSGNTRVSKEEAHVRLTTAIEAAEGVTADSDIVSKLTGKAALYFAELLEKINA